MSEPNPKLSEIQNLPVAELSDRLEGLTADELTALRALEAEQKDGGRKTALTAIDEAIAKAASQPASDGQGSGEGAASGEITEAADTVVGTPPSDVETFLPGANTLVPPPVNVAAKDEPEATPDWQREAYDGPLTIPQAEWRRGHIKPARAGRDK